MIVPLTREYIPAVMSLFNRAAEEETLYKTMTEEQCTRFFLQQPGETYTKTGFVCRKEGQIIGFSSGCIPMEGKTGYITYVYVMPEWRRKGFGRALTEALEAVFWEKAEKMDIVFYNPMQLPWWIPDTRQTHDHPCAPGVDMSGPAFLFFKRTGYRCFAYQNSYYQNLENYRYPPDILDKIEALRQADIEVTCYDRTKHTGLAELFDDLNNPGWKQAILANEARGAEARPLLTAIYQGRTVCGYTGPLSVSPEGRGCFHGIGVHHNYRQHGAGKVLFSTLCMELRKQGASFMSLYTGEDNPARNIYEAAGFRIVRSWADMRKIRRG
ncbi:MAG: GNAT family N-acetyltransferase [Clostridia bacterium]|nr:GNAT family N-acetyltransferase [Clostridia bacterium]